MTRLLYHPGVAGLAVRIFVVSLLLVLVLLLLIGLRCAECLPLQLSEKQILIAFTVAAGAAVTAKFFNEFPGGKENAILRLGLTTIFRSGFPAAVIVAGATVNSNLVTVEMICVLMLFYCIGLFSSLYLEIGRLNRQTQSRGNL